jgi:hypothetical protein
VDRQCLRVVRGVRGVAGSGTCKREERRNQTSGLDTGAPASTIGAVVGVGRETTFRLGPVEVLAQELSLGVCDVGRVRFNVAPT